MKKPLITTVIALCIIVASTSAQVPEKKVELKTEAAQTSYALGVQLARIAKVRNSEVDVEALVAGVSDSVKGDKLLLADAELTRLVQTFTRSEQAAEKLAGPPASVITTGARQYLGEKTASTPYKVGSTLVSNGIARIPRGTPMFPVRFEGLPIAIYYLQDEFGEWKILIEGQDAPLPVGK